MTDKEVKSFDTVDLLAPMDLITIKGSESPAIKVETESKPEANTKTEKSTWDNVSKHVNEGANGYYQNFDNDQKFKYQNNKKSSRQYRNLNVNPMMIFFEEEIEGIKRNSLNREKTKKKIFVILIFVLVIILIAAIRSQIP